jgi:hypothetical protein
MMPALVPGGSHVVLACKADLVIRAVTSFLGERESREHFASISTSALTCVQEEWMAISKRAQTGAVGPHVIAPGPAKKARQDNDPAIESFLSLLAEDMVRFPEQIKPLDRSWSRALMRLLVICLLTHTKTWAASRSFKGTLRPTGIHTIVDTAR